MAVVVYSEKFASSHWCLRELETIMQRWEEKKMMMIPIFYKVSVNELKHPAEKYFDQHIIQHGETIVEKWKDTVIKVGSVSGFPYKDIYGRSERDFITQVIAIIKKQLREWEESGLESTSSKPHNNSGPATKHHDVFVSFMGRDTRYGLVSHLYKALTKVRKDIKTFMHGDDRHLSKDDNIVFEVIQRSKMSVIVFSENYASSKRCLRNLVKILQCSNTTGQVVLPIFYEVNPSDLINQEGKGSRIAYHLEKHASDEEPDTVQSWRDAITDLGNMVGWRYSIAHSKTELADFIGELVEDISTMLNRLAEKKESTRNQQACVSAKDENTQALEVQADIEKGFTFNKNIEKCLEVLQEDGVSSITQSFTHTNTTTDEEEVYSIVTSAYFQQSSELFTGKLISIEPSILTFYVDPEKPSSTCLILTNKTDNHVAFMLKMDTEKPQNYNINPNKGLLWSRSTCQVIVTMEAQTVLPSNEESKDKFLIRSLKAKKDSYSVDDFSNMFTKKLSRFSVDKIGMSVLYVAPPSRDSSVPDHVARLADKGLVHGSMIVESIDTHPTKPWVLLGFYPGFVCIWNYETRVKEKSFKVDDQLAVGAKFINHEKHWILVSASQGFVRVFDYNTSEKVKEFKAHEYFLRSFIVHPTSPYVLTTSDDKLVKLWNWENDWVCIETFKGHSSYVMDAAFNPKDSRSFASVSWDGTIKIWSFGSSVDKFTIHAHARELACVEYFVGNDNKLYLLSCSYDNTIRVWDYASKTLVQTLEGHLDVVKKTLVHPKLPIIITGSLDCTIRIWNKDTHQLKLVWTCDLGQVWSIRFIQASGEVVLGCEDGVVVIKIADATGT